MKWTSENVDTLRVLWSAGVSVDSIASTLETSVYSVMGKAGNLLLRSRLPDSIRVSKNSKIYKKLSIAPEVSSKEVSSKDSLNSNIENSVVREFDSTVGSLVNSLFSNDVASDDLSVIVDRDVALVDSKPNHPVFVGSGYDGWKTGAAHAIHVLRSSGCKWPIGDPKSDDFKFCGKNRGNNRSFCEEHARLAYKVDAKSDRKPKQSGVPFIPFTLKKGSVSVLN